MVMNARARRQSAAAVTALAIATTVVTLGCVDRKSEAKVNALELREVSAYWAVRGKDREQNNFIHPVVRFRVWNQGGSEAGYIQAMAVFKRENFPDEPWGNDFLQSISAEPLAPGSGSDLLTMRSDTNFISKDSPDQMFHNEKWEDVSVHVFLRVGPSSWKPVLELKVPKTIGAPGVEKYLEPETEASTKAEPR